MLVTRPSTHCLCSGVAYIPSPNQYFATDIILFSTFSHTEGYLSEIYIIGTEQQENF